MAGTPLCWQTDNSEVLPPRKSQSPLNLTEEMSAGAQRSTSIMTLYVRNMRHCKAKWQELWKDASHSQVPYWPQCSARSHLTADWCDDHWHCVPLPEKFSCIRLLSPSKFHTVSLGLAEPLLHCRRPQFLRGHQAPVLPSHDPCPKWQEVSAGAQGAIRSNSYLTAGPFFLYWYKSRSQKGIKSGSPQTARDSHGLKNGMAAGPSLFRKANDRRLANYQKVGFFHKATAFS